MFSDFQVLIIIISFHPKSAPIRKIRVPPRSILHRLQGTAPVVPIEGDEVRICSSSLFFKLALFGVGHYMGRWRTSIRHPRHPPRVGMARSLHPDGPLAS